MYEVKIDFLKQLWCHAKNIEALYFMKINNIHCFWHEELVTITNKGWICVIQGKKDLKIDYCSSRII